LSFFDTISEFRIVKLNKRFDVELKFDQNSLILIGPNGAGKSNIIFIFYLIITAQWSRLVDYNFYEVVISFKSGLRFSIKHDDCLRFKSHDKKSSVLLDYYGPNLKQVGLYNIFLTRERFTRPIRDKIVKALGIPDSEFHRYRRRMVREASEYDYHQRLADLDQYLQENLEEQVLFLPTYRRIEQDFGRIFPKIDERMRRYGGPDFNFDRKSSRFHEIIQFGMEDINKLWKDAASAIDRYARTQLNALAATYLRDVIRERAKTYNTLTFQSLTDEKISSVINRVSETSLNDRDKRRLRNIVTKIAENPQSIDQNEHYIAHYFEQLIELSDNIEDQERLITELISRLNEYLWPEKSVQYDNEKYSIELYTDDFETLELSALSSGEKQVVSLLSALYLGASDKYLVIVDEPELSLSVPWQEMFLFHVAKAPKTGALLAVTHSPFTYAYFPDEAVKDVTKFISKNDDV
jgi:ABC-type Mn2+/Zn2+ transport system ATPase subunit